ncbi:CPBP family intramembrane glutamic endopeptidase [Paenibacillus sp. NPDC058174]|uniref:CPBP family intramembrane glutamic endopeptidase n=1 Tax=Paenibacillus sp. NPDC058174 TaxID=3346366 RepID=UPI0036D853B4
MKKFAAVAGKIALSFIVVLLISVVVGIVYTIIAVASGTGLEDIQSASQDNLWMQIIQTILFTASAFGMYALFERKKRWPLGLRQPDGGVMLVHGMLAGIVLISLSAVIIWAFGGVSWTSGEWNADLTAALLKGLVLFIFVAVSEEVYSRGYVQGLLRYHYGSKAAIIVTSLLFALLHGMNPGILDSPWPIINLILAGLIFGIARELTGGLWWPIGMHLTWNYLQGNIYGFNVSGTTVDDSILYTTDKGPAWLSGASFGIEGSLISIIMLLFGITAVYFLYRRKNRA